MEKLRFEEIELSNDMQKGISAMGFEEMSPIQEQSIPIILEGKDIIGQAQTGTGKTAAFGIPILEKVDPNNKNIQALILCPTRELSIQVSEEINKLGKFKRGLKVLPVYGGQPISRQIKALKKGVQIVIGTPGRVIDHINRRNIKLENIKFMVLDEADEMFDMGFRDDMELVISGLQEERQTIFFSATMSKDIIKFASKYQKNPETVKVVHKELTVPNVEQYYFELKSHMKTEILSRLIDLHNPNLTVVFCNTKKKVDELVGDLQGRGYSADGLHGDLKQNQRDAVMNKFRRGTIDILVATDVAARGLDVDEVDLVINYDMPQDDEYYVHRIGRTARAGREGMALSFVSRRDAQRLKSIQKYTKTKIKRKDIPTLKDLESINTKNILNKVKEEIEKDKLNDQEKTLELLTEEGFTTFQIAAALLKLYTGESNPDGHEELDHVDRSSSHRKVSKGKAKRIYIGIGNIKKVSPRHILAAILQETSIPKDYVGGIDIFDRFSFVEIPSEYADEVVETLNGKKIKGSRVTVEFAKPKRR